jgi:hypothetical protein
MKLFEVINVIYNIENMIPQLPLQSRNMQHVSLQQEKKQRLIPHRQSPISAAAVAD